MGDHATNLVSTIYQHVGNDTFRRKYTYDSKGNISHIHEDGKLIVRYKYDGLNRLIREDNAQLGKSFTIEYDHKGNILYKGEYPFSLRALNEGNITSFDYIEDKLATCEYDVLGNPIVYKGKALKWKHLKNLAQYEDMVFDYDASGLRTTKSTANTNTRYYYANNKLLAEKRTVASGDLELGDYLYEGEIYYTYTDKTDISYMYNANELTGFIFKHGEIEDTYYYRKNLQGDITHIYDASGSLKAEYVYDAWGNHRIFAFEDGNSVDITSNLSYNNIGHVNPFRYRGYYYDVETGLYYLQSRYYDPQYGRFINADSIDNAMLQISEINGLNLYAFCLNNPVNNSDPTGGFVLTSFLIGLGIAALIGAGVGAVAYTASEVISYTATGEWNWSWGMFAGSVIGGAIGGALAFALPGLGIAGSAFVTGALSQGIGMGLQNAWEGTNHSFGDILVSSLITGGISAATAGLTSKLRISGFTGRGSVSQVARQISTKFYNGTIGRITMSTFGKIISYEAAYSMFNVFADVLINALNHYKRPGSAWGYSYA